MDYGINKTLAAQECGSMVRPTTVTEQLTARKEHLEQQLARVNAALEALQANPAVENTLNLIQQAAY